ncbi:hypothetical protein PHYBLDRAFT_150947 [Phycomyces blakesleeanus NRRL 1555(-)]|uniref:MULE transposase domain-containing protein n=1 Tax=Phycomyces blakesleeanus (strain ATCC 8743b / DSM 1359 / FGSC 10004 / NBRC 33097 / NRRL 1555) TaxID=763407 RepID=A0A167KDX8_PHYB8|nr:hypothetical protein PHYBLDRAFT_150947 [Phycomyces blakesleeanus NRRL 1555(-)]OAD67866.1 hypothetical protein PHYBLDRAFT_150947 [Phycomyces blakesleeanus NRRL 1555(-)]|eukprot:XP_018285906.1 hypothetical protein PHYBLDRAFT_150947 [Phycomyces blakesleeanus NRRL 1555(-)]
MSNFNNTNYFAIASEASSKKYDAALTEFNSIFLAGREFFSTVAIREAVKAYGAKHNIIFTTYSSSSTRIRMISKPYGEYRNTEKAEKVVSEASVNQEIPLPGWERQRKDGKIVAHSCKIKYNHAIVEDRRAYFIHQKLLPEVMTLVTKHLEDNDDILTSSSYTVGNSEGNNISMVFFFHEDTIGNARRMPETIVTDATYKINSYRITYVNFFGISNVSGDIRTTLKTFTITGPWVEQETIDNCLWVLGCLRDAFWLDVSDSSSNSENNHNSTTTTTALLPRAFITDNEKSLRNSITGAFPESKKLVCSKCIKDNFKK